MLSARWTQESFSTLIGLRFTNRQFVRRISKVSIVKTQIPNIAPGGFAPRRVLDIDADWDDESGEV